MSKWYRVGTVSVVNGSDLVTGVATYWEDGALTPKSGDMFIVDNVIYEILEITGNGNLKLQKPYVGVTANGIAYEVVLNASGTSNTRLFSGMQEVIDKLGNKITVATAPPVAGQGNDGDIIVVVQE